jgi:hypothetical protein
VVRPECRTPGQARHPGGQKIAAGGKPPAFLKGYRSCGKALGGLNGLRVKVNVDFAATVGTEFGIGVLTNILPGL